MRGPDHKPTSWTWTQYGGYCLRWAWVRVTSWRHLAAAWEVRVPPPHHAALHPPDPFLMWFRKTYVENVEYPTAAASVPYHKLPASMRSLIFTQARHDFQALVR